MTTPLPLEPIETASRDELTALQLERLKWSLRHAYDHSPSIVASSTTRVSTRTT